MSGLRSLPPRPSLRRLRDEAKSRRRSGEFSSLAQAQLAVAREHGFVSWPRLRAHVEARALDAGTRALVLVRSACSSDLSRARALLAADPNLARHDLACACATGEAADVALRLGHAPELAGSPAPPFGWEPILYACFSRFLRADPERAAGIRAVVRLLLDAGADPNASFDHEGWIQVPLYGAAGIANDAELTRMLLEAGADPDDAGDRAVGEALYHAVEFPDTTCAALLVEAGTDPVVVEHCLGRALDFPDPAMAEMLCARGARASGANLQHAVFKRRPARTVRALLAAGAPVDARDDSGLTPLQVASRWGDAELASVLLEHGADPSAIRPGDAELGAYLAGAGPAPAHAAGLDAMLDQAVHAGDLGAVRRLLDAGARVDGDPAEERAPLAQAAWRGQADVVQLLVERGVPLAWDDGSPIGALLHGSLHCHDPQGGPSMRTVDEVPREHYARVARILLDAGAAIPERLWAGAPSAVSLLAELGVEVPRCERPPRPLGPSAVDL